MMSPRRERRRGVYAVVGVVAAVGLIVIGLITIPGQDSAVPAPPPVSVLLDLFAPRDIGVIPVRSSWCTSERTAEHCWLLQEASGNAVDTGSGATWDLVPTGSPRQGVVPSLPVAGATIDTTTEKAMYADTVGDLRKASVTQNASAQWSITIVASLYDDSATTAYLYDFGLNGQTNGFAAFISAAGQLNVRADCGTLVTKTVTAPLPDGAWHCLTVAYDGTSTAVYWDGVTATMPAFTDYGTCAATSVNIALANRNSGGLTHQGGIARARVDYAALTLAQHQTLCGSLWSFAFKPSMKIASADLSWTQTGSTRCFAQSATTALCAAGGSPSHTYSSTLSGFGWGIESDRTNLVLDGVDVCSTGGNWTVGGAASATCDNAVAPNGSKMADSITVGAAAPDVITQAITGYGVSATLYPRLWIKCSSGTLTIDTTVGAGQWDIACATVGGAWTELASSSHAAVTEVTPWASDGAGALTLRFDGAASVSADVWGITLVEEAAGLSVIPTTGAAAATGTITWLVDNDPPVYWDSARGAMTMIADASVVGNLNPALKTVSLFSAYLLESIDHWYVIDSGGATVSRCKLDYSTGTTSKVRWNSGAAVEPSGAFVECLIDDVQQTWATKRTTPYVPRTAAEATLQLAADSTAPTMILQRFTVESAP